jgi:hypothetical protein
MGELVEDLLPGQPTVPTVTSISRILLNRFKSAPRYPFYFVAGAGSLDGGTSPLRRIYVTMLP